VLASQADRPTQPKVQLRVYLFYVAIANQFNPNNLGNKFVHLMPGHTNNISPALDAKERRSQRDRERYAAISVEQRNEVNKRRRESHQQKKGQTMMLQL
jgi:hypothetical protein